MHSASAESNAAIVVDEVRQGAGEALHDRRTTRAVPPRRPSLLDAVLESPAVAAERPGLLESFLAEKSVAGALRWWLGPAIRSGEALDWPEIAQLLGRDIARLDQLLTDQVNAILHHPAFQRLESSWRGLRLLVGQNEEAENVKIRVLNVSWKELARDLERAIEFDQSQLFRKVYGEEFDTPGGEPFSVLIGDYQIRPRPAADHPFDDVSLLASIAQVAAAAFAPFIASVHPSMFGLDDFSGMEQPLNFARAFEQLDYLKWRAFRESEDSRFVGLTLPRVLMRLPYEDDGTRVDGFRFREDVSARDRERYLWGSPAYAFAGVLIRSFARSGWLAEIRGARRGETTGGLVAELPADSFSTDKRGVAPKSSTDVVITDALEPELSELGFIPLCHCKDTDRSAFYTAQSAQKPKRYDTAAATMNARISSMLQYMLCVSRFAHYIKVVARDKIGSFAEPEEIETFLNQWLQRYVTSDSEASPDVKAEYPLREARVQVREHPGKPGSYLCIAHLWPHFELDELTASVRVTTELTPGQPA